MMMLIVCVIPQSPVLKTQTITISDVTNSLRGTVAYKDMPYVHTETKTIMYESAQVRSMSENHKSLWFTVVAPTVNIV